MAITWSTPTGYDFSAKAVCTSGTESAPTGASAGLSLVNGTGVGSVSIFVEATDGVTALTAGTLDAYSYNPISGNWGKILGMDGAIPGGSVRYALPGLSVNPMGRFAVIPTGLGTAVTIYLNGLTVGVAGV